MLYIYKVFEILPPLNNKKEEENVLRCVAFNAVHYTDETSSLLYRARSPCREFHYYYITMLMYKILLHVIFTVYVLRNMQYRRDN